jgi:50S ribosomal subunit-associated GTPase HflX
MHGDFSGLFLKDAVGFFRDLPHSLLYEKTAFFQALFAGVARHEKRFSP